jgi:hypothetical protein
MFNEQNENDCQYISDLFCSIPLDTVLYQLCQIEQIDFWAAANTFTEMIHLIPLVSETFSLFPLVIYSVSKVCPVDNSVAGARIAILGGIIVFISLPLDSSICYFVSYHAPSIKTSPLFYYISSSHVGIFWM